MVLTGILRGVQGKLSPRFLYYLCPPRDFDPASTRTRIFGRGRTDHPAIACSSALSRFWSSFRVCSRCHSYNSKSSAFATVWVVMLRICLQLLAVVLSASTSENTLEASMGERMLAARSVAMIQAAADCRFSRKDPASVTDSFAKRHGGGVYLRGALM